MDEERLRSLRSCSTSHFYSWVSDGSKMSTPSTPGSYPNSTGSSVSPTFLRFILGPDRRMGNIRIRVIGTRVKYSDRVRVGEVLQTGLWASSTREEVRVETLGTDTGRVNR